MGHKAAPNATSKQNDGRQGESIGVRGLGLVFSPYRCVGSCCALHPLLFLRPAPSPHLAQLLPQLTHHAPLISDVRPLLQPILNDCANCSQTTHLTHSFSFKIQCINLLFHLIQLISNNCPHTNSLHTTHPTHNSSHTLISNDCSHINCSHTIIPHATHLTQLISNNYSHTTLCGRCTSQSPLKDLCALSPFGRRVLFARQTQNTQLLCGLSPFGPRLLLAWEAQKPAARFVGHARVVAIRALTTSSAPGAIAKAS